MNRLAATRSLAFSTLIWVLLAASVSDWTNVADILSTRAVTHSCEDAYDLSCFGEAALASLPVLPHSVHDALSSQSGKHTIVAAAICDEDSPSLRGPTFDSEYIAISLAASKPYFLPTFFFSDDLYLRHCSLLI